MRSASTLPGTLNAAVLFLVFNRPDTTAQVFEAIRQAKPPRLYVAADGPRHNRPGEAGLCAEVRRIATNVDWPCEVKTLFRENNMGCKLGVCEGINWFFEMEEMGIILEDDCLPSPSFFEFCSELLGKYANDTRVGHIAGTSFFGAQAFGKVTDSYVFSRYGSVWGWATWKRAWEYYDVSLRDWGEMSRRRWLNSAIPGRRERAARLKIAEELISGRLNTWDYQWSFARMFNSMLSIVPTTNLVVNLGFDSRATHTRNVDIQAPTSISNVGFPLRHPPFILPDSGYDALFEKERFANGFVSRIRHKVGQIFGSRGS